jgi:hypothetical protein
LSSPKNWPIAVVLKAEVSLRNLQIPLIISSFGSFYTYPLSYRNFMPLLGFKLNFSAALHISDLYALFYIYYFASIDWLASIIFSYPVESLTFS